jgi:hypothetical protein
VFLREGYAGYITPYRVVVVVIMISFLSTAYGLEFLLFDGVAGTLLQLQCSAGSLCTVRGWPSSTSRVADGHSVRSWDSSSCTGET